MHAQGVFANTDKMIRRILKRRKDDKIASEHFDILVLDDLVNGYNKKS